MDHSVSPVSPTPVPRNTTRLAPLTSPGDPPRKARRCDIATFALLLALLMVTFVPGHTAAQEVYSSVDECYYLNEGGQWTQRRCPQPDGSEYLFAPKDGQWDFVWECLQTSLFRACLSANHEYVETYPDGSTYTEVYSATRERVYLINHTDGTVAEAGYYDASGTQRAYKGASTMKNSAAMRNRSLMYWYYHGLSVQTVVKANPSAFAGLITMNPASNTYANCLHLNDSSDDFDGDGRTGFNELADYCTAQAFS